MREYILLVAVSAIVAACTDILAPLKWRSYIRIVTGFLILAVIISPLAKLKNKDVFNDIESFEVSDLPLKDKVLIELSGRVSADIEERLLSEFKIDAEASVVLDTDEEHKIRGVKKIVVKSAKEPKGAKERLKEVYGCDDIEFEH